MQLVLGFNFVCQQVRMLLLPLNHLLSLERENLIWRMERSSIVWISDMELTFLIYGIFGLNCQKRRMAEIL